MTTKAISIETMDEAGTGLAKIATLSAVDSDGDTYAPGAFAWKDGGQWCSILPAHDRRSAPLGKALVYEEGDAALAKLHFNLDVAEAKSWHSAIMFDLAQGRPVQEYSYGFGVLDHAKDMRGGDRVRVLKQLDVHEVSPVLRGAGAGTGTISMKNAGLKAEAFGRLLTELGTMADALKGDPSALSATGRKQMAEIHAALGAALSDPSADDQAVMIASAAYADYLRFQSRHFLDY